MAHVPNEGSVNKDVLLQKVRAGDFTVRDVDNKFIELRECAIYSMNGGATTGRPRFACRATHKPYWTRPIPKRNQRDASVVRKPESEI